MKKYIKPNLQVIRIAAAELLAGSQTLNVTTGTTYTGGFNSREDEGDNEW